LHFSATFFQKSIVKIASLRYNKFGDGMEKDFIITQISQIVMVGKERYPEKRTAFGTQVHSNELIFHLSGEVTVFFGDQIMETLPKTVRFLPKGRVSRYEVDRHTPGDCIDIFFLTDRPVASEAFVVDASKTERVGRLFKRIFHTWVSKEEGYYHECIALLYTIFAELEKESYMPSDRFLKIKPALDMIHNCFLQQTPSISELSAVCGISDSYLKQLFKEKYGIPPKKYIIQRKLNHACDLLRMERYSITQVAELCGFSDVYFFSRQFKVHLGITPTQFVKKYKSSK